MNEIFPKAFPGHETINESFRYIFKGEINCLEICLFTEIKLLHYTAV